MTSPVSSSTTADRGVAADDALAKRLDGVAGVLALEPDAAARAAVLLEDDHVLRDVDEAARQVAGVRRAERRVGETLAGAVRRDEVLEHGEALAERADGSAGR